MDYQESPVYEELWAHCGYCGCPTADVAYLSQQGLYLCHACADWAQVLRRGRARGTLVLTPETAVFGNLFFAPPRWGKD
jgi:hypothetical protein